MLTAHTVGVAEALNEVTEYWTPRVIGRVNDQYVKVAKLKGELAWHDHAEEDEMFFVIYGNLTIQFEGHEITLAPGEFYIVPKKTRHNPIAKEECGVMLIETVSTKHTGDQILPGTVSLEKQLNIQNPKMME